MGREIRRVIPVTGSGLGSELLGRVAEKIPNWPQVRAIWRMRIDEHPECVRAALDSLSRSGTAVGKVHRWLTAAYCAEVRARHPACNCGGCTKLIQARILAADPESTRVDKPA